MVLSLYVRISEEPEYEELAVDKSERVEIEYNEAYLEEEEDGWKNRRANWEMERIRDEEERNSGGYMRDGEDEEVDVEVDEMNYRDEHRAEMDGFKEVRRDAVKERRKRNEYEVFVGGLDRDADEVDLREVFGAVGDITEVRLMKNPITNKNKGFAFIRFATIEQCRRAVNELKHPVV